MVNQASYRTHFFKLQTEVLGVLENHEIGNHRKLNKVLCTQTKLALVINKNPSICPEELKRINSVNLVATNVSFLHVW